MQKKTLWIDLDGTLLGSNSLLLRLGYITLFCWQMLKRGINPWQSLKTLKTMRMHLEMTTSLKESNLERAAQIFAKLTAVPLSEARIFLTKSSLENFRLLRRVFHPIPEALDFLNWANQKFDLVLATNPVWPLEVVKFRMALAGIDPDKFLCITHA